MGSSSSDTYGVIIGFGVMAAVLVGGTWYCFRRMGRSSAAATAAAADNNGDYARVVTRAPYGGGGNNNNQAFEMWSSA
jgi:hypothetical protein